MKHRSAALVAAITLALGTTAASAKNGPGVTAKEIKLGNTMPYSGNASEYGANGKAEAAYFAMINEQGGINGRKISFITLDDAYSPPKTVELTRQLVERDQVFAMFAALGTAPNTAVQKYLNQRKVPQIFVGTGASKWGDPQHFPWTIGLIPAYRTEGAIYAKHLLRTHKDGKVAVLMQNDDVGRDYLEGFKEGLGDKADKMIVATATYEVTDPTVESQVIQLKNSGADVLFSPVTPKFAAQEIRKVAELGWKPIHYLVNVAASVGGVIKPAGFENAQGIMTALYAKDVSDPQWAEAPDVLAWKKWMAKYNPNADISVSGYTVGYIFAATMVQTLKQCGDDLSRENLMKQAANLKDVEIPMLIPGVRLNTSPTDFYPIQTLRMARMTEQHWESFGDPISSDKD